MSQETVKAALMKAIAGIQSNPGAARVVFRAETQLEENVQCSAKVRDFAPITVDEPPELGGSDAGANPVEFLLVALGTCQEIMYSAYASVMGVQLNSVKVNLRGYLDLRGLFAMDAAIPAGYQKIIFETQVDSPADLETLRNLVETVESHCPVLDSLVRAIPVSGQVTINGQLMDTIPAVRVAHTIQDLIAYAKTHITEWDSATAARRLAAHNNIVLLDVREPHEFSEGCIGDACNVPRGVLEFKVDPTYPACAKELLDRDLEILVYCKTGGRSALAAHTLKQLGYGNVVSLSGGIEAWRAAGFSARVPQAR